MEMWWYARAVSEPVLLGMMAVAGGIVVLSILFGGFRRGRVTHIGIDTLIVFGIGILISAVTLIVVGRIHPGQLPLSAAARMIALEAIPCAIGAALAGTRLLLAQKSEETHVSLSAWKCERRATVYRDAPRVPAPLRAAFSPGPGSPVRWGPGRAGLDRRLDLHRRLLR
jgi:hypothetical protein